MTTSAAPTSSTSQVTPPTKVVITYTGPATRVVVTYSGPTTLINESRSRPTAVDGGVR